MSFQTSQPVERPLFREEQFFDQWWIKAVIVVLWLVWLSTVGRDLYAEFRPGRLDGGQPKPLLGLILAGLPSLAVLSAATWALLRVRLILTLDRASLHIRFYPLRPRIIRLDQIAAWQSVVYSPLRDCGGWGFRYDRRHKRRVYNVKGNLGLELVLADGAKLLLGSQRPGELAEALALAKGRA